MRSRLMKELKNNAEDHCGAASAAGAISAVQTAQLNYAFNAEEEEDNEGDEGGVEEEDRGDEDDPFKEEGERVMNVEPSWDDLKSQIKVIHEHFACWQCLDPA